jgi:hypothetical protein
MQRPFAAILLMLATIVASWSLRFESPATAIAGHGPDSMAQASKESCCGGDCRCGEQCPCAKGEPAGPEAPSDAPALPANAGRDCKVLLLASSIRGYSIVPLVADSASCAAASSHAPASAAGRALLERIARWTT